MTLSKEKKPSLAFLGTGWIGTNRMKSLLQEDLCSVMAVHDLSDENADRALSLAPGAKRCGSLQEIIDMKPDGIVIATPSALHAEQSMAALQNRIPVFCQKPLTRDSSESRKLIDTAREYDCLLGTDFSYRYTDGMQKIKHLSREGKLGHIFAVDLVFHNAYGPDKPWFYDPELSGGGCLIDLGIHLVDLALWILDFPPVEEVYSTLFSGGKRIKDTQNQSEDFANAQFTTSDGTSIRISCSWNLSAGKDAEIEASFYGKDASARFLNVNGSFYDFQTLLCHGTSTEEISSPPDDWGGRALLAWAAKLNKSKAFDEEILSYNQIAETIDRIYGKKTETAAYENINDY